MNFSTFDMGMWYDFRQTGRFNLDSYKKWLDQIQDLGFTNIAVDEAMLPLVIDEISSRSFNIHFSILCVEEILDKDSNHYHVQPWRSDRKFITHAEFMDVYYDRLMGALDDSLELLDKIPEYNDVILSLNPATFLESTFYLNHNSYIMDGNMLKAHNEMHNILIDISGGFKQRLCVSQLITSQIFGFGSENKYRYELDGISLCNEITNNIRENVIYLTPTQCAHDSKYLGANILYQHGLKKAFGVKLGWGAMGVMGFPVTVPMAYFNDIDLIFMITNELEFDRMTKLGFDDVSEQQIGLIKDVIKAVNNKDDNFLKKTMRFQSKRFYKSEGQKIHDEHFSLEELS